MLLQETSLPIGATGVETRARKRARMNHDFLSSDQLARVRQLLAEGAAKKALQSLTSEGSHDPTNPFIWNRLLELHPQNPTPLPPELPAQMEPMVQDVDPEFWEKKVGDAISHFQRGSAPGVGSGLEDVEVEQPALIRSQPRPATIP